RSLRNRSLRSRSLRSRSLRNRSLRNRSLRNRSLRNRSLRSQSLRSSCHTWGYYGNYSGGLGCGSAKPSTPETMSYHGNYYGGLGCGYGGYGCGHNAQLWNLCDLRVDRVCMDKSNYYRGLGCGYRGLSCGNRGLGCDYCGLGCGYGGYGYAYGNKPMKAKLSFCSSFNQKPHLWVQCQLHSRPKIVFWQWYYGHDAAWSIVPAHTVGRVIPESTGMLARMVFHIISGCMKDQAASYDIKSENHSFIFDAETGWPLMTISHSSTLSHHHIQSLSYSLVLGCSCIHIIATVKATSTGPPRVPVITGMPSSQQQVLRQLDMLDVQDLWYVLETPQAGWQRVDIPPTGWHLVEIPPIGWHTVEMPPKG
ncbi:hypothetical protein GH733_013670, partial [Mirounga leonina]